ncbi:MAG: hypothetical protein JJE04_27135 [Acidobacteriia bacterium]|nr:hypothetical protein [Terriglobia bacterium]
MISLIMFAAIALLAPAGAFPQAGNPELKQEIDKIDAYAANPDRKFAAAAAIAGHLKIHRNRLALLSRQTGQSYGRLFQSQLEQAGYPPEEILLQARLLNTAIQRSLSETGDRPDAPSSVAPVLYLSTSVDHNSAGTFYTAAPQIGVESRNGVLTLTVPFYRNSGVLSSSGGIGDLLANGHLFGNIGDFQIGGGILLGVPTGNRSLGLSAGKVTFDGVAQLAWQPGKVRVFVSPGFANSVFNNVVYQRPYISDGNAAHLTSGIEFQAHRRIVIGAGGFALRPLGAQSVISRVSAEPAPTNQPAQPQPTQGPPPGPGKRVGPKNRPPNEPPVFEQGTIAEVSAQDLRDHGASVWSYVRLHPALTLHLAVARSVPFRLTTARVGLGFNVARLLPRARH